MVSFTGEAETLGNPPKPYNSNRPVVGLQRPRKRMVQLEICLFYIAAFPRKPPIIFYNLSSKADFYELLLAVSKCRFKWKKNS